MEDYEIVEAMDQLWTALTKDTPDVLVSDKGIVMCIYLAYESEGIRVLHSVLLDKKRSLVEELTAVDPSQPIVADRLLGSSMKHQTGTGIIDPTFFSDLKKKCRGVDEATRLEEIKNALINVRDKWILQSNRASLASDFLLIPLRRHITLSTLQRMKRVFKLPLIEP